MQFYDDLALQLRDAEQRIAAEPALAAPVGISRRPRPQPGRAPRRRRAWTWPSVALGTGLVAIAAVMIGLVVADPPGRDSPAGARSSPVLAILQTEVADAAPVRRGVAPSFAAQLDLRSSHQFSTPNGPGFVIPATDGRRLCVTIPDVDGYGSTCAPKAAVERDGIATGLVAQSAAQAREHPSIEAVVLPTGQTTARFVPKDGGAPRTLAAVHGVVVLAVREAGNIEWKKATGAVHSEPVLPYDVVTSAVVDCGKKGFITIRPNQSPAGVCRRAPAPK